MREWHSLNDENRDISTIEQLEFHAELDEDEDEDTPDGDSGFGRPATQDPAGNTMAAATGPGEPGERRRWPGRQQ